MNGMDRLIIVVHTEDTRKKPVLSKSDECIILGGITYPHS